MSSLLLEHLASKPDLDGQWYITDPEVEYIPVKELLSKVVVPSLFISSSDPSAQYRRSIWRHERNFSIPPRQTLRSFMSVNPQQLRKTC